MELILSVKPKCIILVIMFINLILFDVRNNNVASMIPCCWLDQIGSRALICAFISLSECVYKNIFYVLMFKQNNQMNYTTNWINIVYYMQKMKSLSQFLTFSNQWLWFKELFSSREIWRMQGGEGEKECAAEQKARCNAGEWDDKGELPFVLLSLKSLDRSLHARSKSLSSFSCRSRSAPLLTHSNSCNSSLPQLSSSSSYQQLLTIKWQ